MLVNGLSDNWFMGTQPVQIRTLGELLEKIEGFSPDFKLTDNSGNELTLRMGERGILVIATNAQP